MHIQNLLSILYFIILKIHVYYYDLFCIFLFKKINMAIYLAKLLELFRVLASLNFVLKCFFSSCSKILEWRGRIIEAILIWQNLLYIGSIFVVYIAVNGIEMLILNLSYWYNKNKIKFFICQNVYFHKHWRPVFKT